MFFIIFILILGHFSAGFLGYLTGYFVGTKE